MKTIIFDFGNVVGFFDHYRAIAKMQPFCDLPAREMFRLVYESELEDVFEKGRIGEAEFLDRVIGLWKLRCDAARLAEAVADIFEPNPEICAIIPRLAGRYRLLLGSNTNALHARRFLAQFADTLRHFDRLILSFEIGTRKPGAAFFAHCLAHAGCDAEECLFVDDLASNVEGAYRAGIKGLVYGPGVRLSEALRALGVALEP